MKKGKAIITTSWDDGHPLDIKLSKLMKTYSIEGTFYAPLTNWANDSLNFEQIKNLSSDFEIGGHTYNHAILTLIPDYRMELELSKSKAVLEEITKKEVISFCYPLGRYNKYIVDSVKKAGYKGSRTSKIFRISFSDPYEFHPTIHATERNLPSKAKGIIDSDNLGHSSSLLLKGGIFKKWDTIAKKSLDYVLDNGGIWHLWGHSWEIDQKKDWQVLEEVLRYVQKQGKEYGAEFLTNGTIFKENN